MTKSIFLPFEYVFYISRSENQPSFYIILTWSVSIRLIVLNLEVSVKISIILFLYPIYVDLFVCEEHVCCLLGSIFSTIVSEFRCYICRCLCTRNLKLKQPTIDSWFKFEILAQFPVVCVSHSIMRVCCFCLLCDEPFSITT